MTIPTWRRSHAVDGCPRCNAQALTLNEDRDLTCWMCGAVHYQTVIDAATAAREIAPHHRRARLGGA